MSSTEPPVGSTPPPGEPTPPPPPPANPVTAPPPDQSMAPPPPPPPPAGAAAPAPGLPSQAYGPGQPGNLLDRFLARSPGAQSTAAQDRAQFPGAQWRFSGGRPGAGRSG